MKTIILASLILSIPNISHSSESIICAYTDTDSKIMIHAEVVPEEEWDNGLIIMYQEKHFRVYSLSQGYNSKNILTSIYMSEEWENRQPSNEEIEKKKRDIRNSYKGANLFPDVEVDVPGLFVVQQAPSKIVNNKYIDKQQIGIMRTKFVLIEKRDNRKVEEYCPEMKFY